MQHPPSPRPVKPIIDGGRHVLAWDDVRVEIDAAIGGRVTALRFGGRNLLTEPAADAGNYGSTFWPSPQTAWGWPPLAEIDHGPYRAELEPAAITMRSAINPALGVEVEKRFAADAARGAVTFDFAITTSRRYRFSSPAGRSRAYRRADFRCSRPAPVTIHLVRPRTWRCARRWESPGTRTTPPP